MPPPLNGKQADAMAHSMLRERGVRDALRRGTALGVLGARMHTQ